MVKCSRCNQVFFQLPINQPIKLIDSCKSFNHHNTYRNCIGISISIAFTTVPPIIHYPHPQTYLLSSACTIVSSACTTVSSASASASTNCNRIHNCISYHPHPLTLLSASTNFIINFIIRMMHIGIRNCISCHPLPHAQSTTAPSILTSTIRISVSIITYGCRTTCIIDNCTIHTTVSPIIRIHMHNRQLHHPYSHPQFAYRCQSKLQTP